MPVVRKTDCINYGFILKRLQLNQDTKFTKINLPRYLEQQKKNTSKLLSDAKGNIKDTLKIVNAAMNKKELYWISESFWIKWDEYCQQ